MAIKTYSASADTTITNAYKPDLTTRGTGSNMGFADVLEVFSIYGQASSSSDELSRILIKFPTTVISEDRDNTDIPASGSVDFYLRLHNTKHSTTLPKNFTLEVRQLTKDWEEGRGLDMDEYRDETYELEGANWMYASSGSKWTRVGGDFKDNEINGGDTDNGNDGERLYSQVFDDGTENLEINITEAVEEWLAAASATATLTATSKTAGQANTRVLTIADVEGNSVNFTIDNSISTSTATSIAFGNANSNANQFATNIAAAVNASALNITASASTATVTLTMTTKGTAGNSVANIAGTAVTDSIITVEAQWASGAGHSNYGVIVKMSGSQEAYHSGSNIVYNDGAYTSQPAVDADPNLSSLNNLTGSEDSYYTKKFFARSSQYFFKTPRIEARWDSSIRDDSANFYVSSALAPELDNVNTVYLYNYVRGQLQNIPVIGDSLIYMALHTGSSRENLDPVACEVKDHTPGGGTSNAFHTFVTGGWVETGIYSASVVVTSSLSSNNYYVPVWQHGTEETNAGRGANDRGMTTLFTGSAIDAKTFDTRQGNPSLTYVSSMPNLKRGYTRKETARLRLTARDRDWCPTIYTVAKKEQQDIKIIENAYYRVFREVDEYEVIPYGTGSSTTPQAQDNAESYTRLSFDVSGNYFDFDMSLLEAGYSYGLQYTYYVNGSWKEQPETFNFRVEE